MKNTIYFVVLMVILGSALFLQNTVKAETVSTTASINENYSYQDVYVDGVHYRRVYDEDGKLIYEYIIED